MIPVNADTPTGNLQRSRRRLGYTLAYSVQGNHLSSVDLNPVMPLVIPVKLASVAVLFPDQALQQGDAAPSRLYGGSCTIDFGAELLLDTYMPFSRSLEV